MRCMTMFGAVAAMLWMSSAADPARAQFFNSDPCGACATPVQQVQPVMQSCYRTVPVTEYRRERQTVRKPVYKTAYEEQEVTIHRPVTERRTAEVPTISYRNVTEYRQVTRDQGRWITNYHPVCKMAPCQYDSRPGVIGWLSRTGYSMRTAMTPKYTRSRQYVPDVITCNVPYTRQVAVRGTRKVSYDVTRMVAERKTERVPVQRLTYVDEEVTVMRPVTAYRTVPIGTSIAYAPTYGGSSIAYAPGWGGAATAFGGGYIIDETATAAAPTADPISGPRTANSQSGLDDDDDVFNRRKFGEDSGTAGARSANDRSLPAPRASNDDAFTRSSFSTSQPAANYSTQSNQQYAPADQGYARPAPAYNPPAAPAPNHQHSPGLQSNPFPNDADGGLNETPTSSPFGTLEPSAMRAREVDVEPASLSSTNVGSVAEAGGWKARGAIIRRVSSPSAGSHRGSSTLDHDSRISMVIPQNP